MGTLRRCPQGVKECASGHARAQGCASARFAYTLEAAVPEGVRSPQWPLPRKLDDGTGPIAHVGESPPSATNSQKGDTVRIIAIRRLSGE